MGSPAKVRIDVITETKQASEGLKETATATKSFGSTFRGVFAGVLGSSLVTSAASKIYNFGKQSVEAYEKSQVNAVKYADAMRRIPGASAANTAALTDQAKALAKVTMYGAGATKSGQAILAGFHLTAAQIKTLTPLMQDYAAKTGKDIPTAATDLGKALLGQTRSLKSIGINIKAASAGTKDAVAAQHQYTSALKGVTSAQDHLRVVQREVASGQLTGAQADSALRAAHARLEERTLTLGHAHDALRAAQGHSGTAASNYGQIVAALQGKVGGLATQMGDTAAGKAAILNNQITALKVNIGSQLQPVMETFVGALLKVMSFISRNADVIKPLVVYLGAIVAVWKLWNIAIAVWNGLLALNPIAIVVIAIIALGAALVIAYQRVGWFRAAVQAMGRAALVAFNWIRDAAAAVFNWIAAHWPLLIAVLTGPLGIAALLIIKNWGTITAIFRSAVATIGGIINTLVGFFRTLPGRIAGAIGAVASVLAAPFVAGFNAIKGAIEDAVNWIKARIQDLKNVVSGGISLAKSLYNPFANAWNAVHVSFTAPKLIPVIGGKTIDFGLPHLPTMASGAWVTSPTFALIGEGGQGEVVAPESKLRQIVRQESGSSTVININVPPTANPAEVGRAVAGVLRSYFAAGGRLQVPA